ncbi:vascular endothelial growth factor A-like [Bacillus rossius redtenbacheri]|uniref:vascular endothelial growth factor A-like n=1 Tax=Bacillus rossius redtenbacheri TaxID=93214 RepID=UPI002FDDD4BF
MRLLALLAACAAVAAATHQGVSDNEIPHNEKDAVSQEVDKEDFGPEEDDKTFLSESSHILYKQVPCGKVMDDLETILTESSCFRLVDVLVNMTEDSRYSYRPTSVKARRCGGMCKARQTCVSMGNKTALVPVERTLLSDQTRDCAYAYIEEDTSCMCKCIVQQKHCSPLQMYDENACECRCMDMAVRKANCLHLGKQWLGDECRCICRNKPRRPCSTGTAWDEDNCRCMKKQRARG